MLIASCSEHQMVILPFPPDMLVELTIKPRISQTLDMLVELTIKPRIWRCHPLPRI